MLPSWPIKKMRAGRKKRGRSNIEEDDEETQLLLQQSNNDSIDAKYKVVKRMFAKTQERRSRVI
jgi:hypothetical protein